MHERSPKNNPLDTILYEIDMLRHCARTVDDKKRRFEVNQSDTDRCEYYLGIEGFLLHLRNLLAFFMSQRDRDTDLGINAPMRWAGKDIDQSEYSDLMKRAREINDTHGVAGSSCYDQISKYLQHCTSHRHEQGRDWDIGRIFAEFDPVLNDFEQRFAPTSDRTPHIVLGMANNSCTATFRTFSFFFPTKDTETME